MKKKINILIPNATSPRNNGDLAMLTYLIYLLNSHFENPNIIIHSGDPELHSIDSAKAIRPTLYFWAVFEDKKFMTRVIRLTKLFFTFLQIQENKQYSSDKINVENQLIDDYKVADLIVFVGGGYLRSQKGVTQSLNLIMLLFHFQFAKLFKNKRVISMPMSFGPFAYKWQEKYSALSLNGLDLISTRENYSHDLLKKYKIKNLVRSHDHALLLKLKKSNKKNKHDIIRLGFTIRNWLTPQKQMRFEDDFSNSLIDFCKETNAVIYPIVQVDAFEYGDIDKSITEKIVKKLKEKGIKTKPIEIVKDLSSSANIYSKIDLLLGMRMHSNILAALQGTPFVSISYEYKTQGISEDLGLGEYCIKIEKVNCRLLLSKLIKASKNIKLLNQKMNDSIKDIRFAEAILWKNILGDDIKQSII